MQEDSNHQRRGSLPPRPSFLPPPRPANALTPEPPRKEQEQEQEVDGANEEVVVEVESEPPPIRRPAQFPSNPDSWINWVEEELRRSRERFTIHALIFGALTWNVLCSTLLTVRKSYIVLLLLMHSS